MRKIIFSFVLTLCAAEASYGQIDVIKATSQKTIGGIGDIFMNYEVQFKFKSSDTILIDSVKTVANRSLIKFFLNKTKKPLYEITFGYSLTAIPKCKTCPDVGFQQSNFTKGVIIYYKKGGRKATTRVKKFKRLDDRLMP